MYFDRVKFYDFTSIAVTKKRHAKQINTSTPRTEVAAETAAAMASASLHRGSYSENIPEVQIYYNSTSYGDELLWAASWLYHATTDQTYLNYVTGTNGESFAN
nr:endoglucanase 2-like [Tanacetum cinerariifolium]